MEVYHKTEPEKLGSKIIRHYNERPAELSELTIEDMQSGAALQMAKIIYMKAIKRGDDTTANDANTIINMLEDK